MDSLLNEMLELKRPTKKNRGIYVKMKLLHKGRQQQHQQQQEKRLCFRYYKWILWFSLTLYFLSSYLITHKPISLSSSSSSSSSTTTTTTHLLSNHESSSSISSRALIESMNSKNSTFVHEKTQIQKDLFNGLKVYIYELPSSYNTDWLSNERCSNHLFASEVAIHKALLKSGFRTFDPYEADFFFVPVYVSCNFSTVNGFPAIGHARSLISSAIKLISSQNPFWNRTQGSDHVFVASHDYGACFHAMEHRAVADGIPDFMKKSIVLQTFGVNYKHPCQEVENVVIPPYIPPESIQRTLEGSPVTGKRDIMVFFRGKMEVNPKNISGRFYSKRVRTVIWRKYNNDRRFYLQRNRFAGYQSEIVRSVFCLCPLGWAPWSPRLVESVALGCVPVIIADGIRLPFSSVVRWPDISLTVAEKDVKNLGKILEHVAATNLTSIQKNLWDPDVKRALLFNDPPVEGDATWLVIDALSTMLDDKSYRRSRVYNQ